MSQVDGGLPEFAPRRCAEMGEQGPESLAQWVALRTARASVDVMAFSGWPDCLHNLDTVTGFPVCSSRFSQKLTVLSWR